MIREILSATIVLLVAGQAEAQNRHQQPPATVQHSFQRDYPQARDPQWSSTNGEWHADFTDRSQYDRGEMVAHYDRSGHHMDSHIPYDRNDVPPAVVERTERRYAGGSDYNYTQIESPGRKPLFQVRVNLRGARKTMYVDEQGREREYHDRH